MTRIFKSSSGREFTTDSDLVARAWARAGLELAAIEPEPWPTEPEPQPEPEPEPPQPTGTWRRRLNLILGAALLGWLLAASYYLVWQGGGK